MKKTFIALLLWAPLCPSPLKRAIVVGASSGIGRAVARELSNQGYIVGLVARRTSLLESLKTELKNPSYIKSIDVTHPHAPEQLNEFIAHMGGLDVMIISLSAYVQARSESNLWRKKEVLIDVDIRGFLAIADTACDYFEKQGYGHLVGISSTSGLRGVGYNPEYSAAKAWESYYLEAKRNYYIQHAIDIQVTDICPGYVATEIDPLGSAPEAYWEVTAQEAACVIVDGIKRKQKVVYVPRKIWLVACLLKYLPDSLYNRYLSWI